MDEVQDLRKITNHSKRDHRRYLNLMNKNQKTTTCNLVLDSGNTRISTDCAQKSPGTLIKDTIEIGEVEGLCSLGPAAMMDG